MVGSCNWILKCRTPDARTFHSDHGIGNWKAFSMSPTTQSWMQSDLGFHNLWNKSVTWFLMQGYSRWASIAVRLSGLSNSSSKRKQYLFKSYKRNPFLNLEGTCIPHLPNPLPHPHKQEAESTGYVPGTVPPILFLSHLIFLMVLWSR